MSLNASIRFALKLLNFSFNLTLLADNLWCDIIGWIGNLQTFIVFLECVDQSRNGNARLIKGPIDFWGRFRIRNNTAMDGWERVAGSFFLIWRNLPSQVLIAFRLELIEVKSLRWGHTFSKCTPVNARLGNAFCCHLLLRSLILGLKCSQFYYKGVWKINFLRKNLWKIEEKTDQNKEVMLCNKQMTSEWHIQCCQKSSFKKKN